MPYPPHIVEIVCTCPDPDTCATNALVADRNTGWKEYFRALELLGKAMAQLGERQRT